MAVFLVLKEEGRQVIDLIFMGRLTQERSHLQERSERVLTAGLWGGERAGALVVPGVVGDKQGKKTKHGEGTVAAVSQG